MKVVKHSNTYGKIGSLLLLAFTAVTVQADYQSTVVSQGPVGYYRLNETQAPPPPALATNLGTLGAAENGTYFNYPAKGVAGPFAGSIGVGFNGVDQYVSAPYATNLNPGTFTIEAWLRPDLTVPPGNLTCVLSSMYSASPRAGWLVYQSGGTNDTTAPGWELRMYATNGTATSARVLVTNTVVPGTYYHVVFTFDGATARGYLNGSIMNSIVPTGAKYVPVPASTTFNVGARSDAGFPWQGAAAEVAYYGAALTADQIKAHFDAATTNTAGYAGQIIADAPQVYYRFTGAADPIAANAGSLGTAGNALYIYDALPGQAGPAAPTYGGLEAANKACGFNSASSGFVRVPSLAFTTNTATITCWVKPNGAQLANAGIVFQRVGTTTSAGLKISDFGNFELAYDWNNAGGSFVSGLNLVDNQWQFIALVVGPDKAELFLHDGAVFNSAVNNGINLNQAFTGVTRIGNYAGPTTNVTFNGEIDEVAIFKRALSAGEVYSQYAAAVGNLPPTILKNPIAPAGTVYEFDTLSLTVDAGGTPSLGYQWRKNGTPIAGATTSAYSIPALAVGDSGNYDAVVTNAYGQATSAQASIAVTALTPPSITTQPVGRTVYPGGFVSMNVVATGGALNYQWSKNGTPIAGATVSSYTIANALVTDAGSYVVVVTNKVGTATSAAAVVGVTSPAAGSYAAAVVADAPVSWWKLDDTDPTTLLDSMGRHDGTYQGSPTFSVPGIGSAPGSVAVGFDGNNSTYGRVPYSPQLNAVTYSIEVWAKAAEIGVDYCAVSSMSVASSSSPYQGRGYMVNADSTGEWRTGTGRNDQYAYYYASLGPIDTNRWAHIVMTYSSTSGQVYYWNGVRVPTTGGYSDFTRNSTADLLVGAVGPGISVFDTYFKGSVDEIAYYSTALSQAQVQAHYQAGLYGNNTAPTFVVQPTSQTNFVGDAVTFSSTIEGTTPIAVQWYKDGTTLLPGQTNASLTFASVAFSDAGTYKARATNAVGSTDSTVVNLVVLSSPQFAVVTNGLVLHLEFENDVQDTSGRGNNGTSVGSPAYVAGKIGGKALAYDTTTSGGAVVTANYVTLGTVTDLQFSSNVNFSVSYWIKLPPGSKPGDLPVLGTAANSYGNSGYVFAPSYQRGGWSYSLNGNVQLYGADNSINNGGWHHLLHTFNRNGNAVTFLDGVQVDSRLMITAGDLDTTGAVTIGQDPTGLYPEAGQAEVDDIGVWTRALSSVEARSIYLVGANYGRSFDEVAPITLTIQKAGSDIELIWQAGKLQEAGSVTGPWTPVAGAVAPYLKVTPGAAAKFYKVAP